MPYIEIDTLASSLKKYTVIYVAGIATGLGLGYKLFHEKNTTVNEHPYTIQIPYKK